MCVKKAMSLLHQQQSSICHVTLARHYVVTLDVVLSCSPKGQLYKHSQCDITYLLDQEAVVMFSLQGHQPDKYLATC